MTFSSFADPVCSRPSATSTARPSRRAPFPARSATCSRPPTSFARSTSDRVDRVAAARGDRRRARRSLARRRAGARPPIPTPASVIGFEPGAERKLPAWKQIVEYFTALAKASPRVQLHTLGKTTLGRPFIVAFISDSATLANLRHYREIQRRLVDPRLQRRRARLADREREERHPHHVEHPLERGRRHPHAARARRPARARRGRRRRGRFSRRRSSHGAVAQSRRRRHRRRLVSQHARHAGGGHRPAGALSSLHGARQQSRLVRVHAGRDADDGRLALQRLASADRQRHPPAGLGRGAALHSAVHGSDRAEHRSDSHRGRERARARR